MGIGEAIARRAVAEGARVLVHGIGAAETGAVASSLGMPFSVGDLASPNHCEEIVAAAVAEFGGLDGVVNNAGVVWRNLIEDTVIAIFKMRGVTKDQVLEALPALAEKADQ